jgi:hypothetical protein
MTARPKSWNNLFLFCLGLAIASAICMKLLEPHFLTNGSLFSIIGLELGYGQEKVVAVLSSIDDHVRSLLRFQLIFDFVFMAGIYPAILSLCMIARSQLHGFLRSFFTILAVTQLIAWACDIYENLSLLHWINDPSSVNHFQAYHTIVWTKWALAIFGALLAIPLVIRNALRNRR